MKEMYIQICFQLQKKNLVISTAPGKPSSSVLQDMILKNDQKKQSREEKYQQNGKGAGKRREIKKRIQERGRNENHRTQFREWGVTCLYGTNSVVCALSLVYVIVYIGHRSDVIPGVCLLVN